MCSLSPFFSEITGPFFFKMRPTEVLFLFQSGSWIADGFRPLILVKQVFLENTIRTSSSSSVFLNHRDLETFLPGLEIILIPYNFVILIR